MKAEREGVVRRLKTVRGQIDGLLRMVDDDRYCIDISNQLMASIAILKNVNKDVLEAHLKSCVSQAMTEGNSAEQEEKIKEIIAVIDKLTR